MAGIFADMVKQALAKGPIGWAQNGEYGGGALTRQLGGEQYGPHAQAAMAAFQGQAMGQGPSATGFQASGAQDQNMRQALQAQGGGGTSGFMQAQQGLSSLTAQTAADLAERRRREQEQMLNAYSQNLFSNQALNDNFASQRERAFADMLLSKSTGQLQHQQAMNAVSQQQVGSMASAAGMGIAAVNNSGAGTGNINNYSQPTMSSDQFGNTVANYSYNG